MLVPESRTENLTYHSTTELEPTTYKRSQDFLWLINKTEFVLCGKYINIYVITAFPSVE